MVKVPDPDPPEKLPPPYGRADSGARYEIQIADIRDVSGQHAVARGLPAGVTRADRGGDGPLQVIHCPPSNPDHPDRSRINKASLVHIKFT